MILPADKGNKTVVMNRKDYDAKIENMLADGTYKKLAKDPTARIERKIDTMLKQVEKTGEIPKQKRLYLTPHSSAPPQLYGLPKVHKPDTPLRPIVSAMDSPTYKLSKEIAMILSPLADKTPSFVKDSSEFARRMRETRFDENDRLVSFDVVSLFTKVPIAEAIDVIAEHLHQDETLGDRTTLSPETICQLMKLCLTSTYFQFRNCYYEQIEGAAMGSPLSPVVANLFMETLEEKALSTTTLKPKIWLRYVDDTFVTWPHGQQALGEFHSHLNNQNQDIQFTMEEESEGELPFLDTLVKRDGSKAITTVYRKPTHTDRYIHFSSHHHPRVFNGAVMCLKNRANNICTTESKTKELNHLKKVFKQNGYPNGVIQRALHRPNRLEPRAEENTESKKLFLPYVKGVSERIEKVCRQLNIKTVFKSNGTLRQTLMRVKNKRPEELRRGVVYEVPCQDCGRSYIGETSRSLQERLKEHKYAVRTANMNNGIAAHAWIHQHQVDWNSAKVKTFEQHLWKRKVLAAICIRETKENNNLDCGLSMSQVWSPLIH